MSMFGGMSHRSGGAGGIGSGYSTPQTPDYEKIGPTRILPHLYIGCAKDALSLETREKHGISHVVNVSANIERPDDLDDDHFLRLPVNDGYIDKLQPHFAQAHQFIDKVHSERNKVLVHCQAGVSRSAALTISYIMNTRRITCEQAYRFVKVMRPVVSPNFNFLGQLLDYERELKLTTSPTSGAGTKRKHMNLSLSELGARPSIESSSKRLSVPTKSDNNNSITSLSPASALAGLTFENSLLDRNNDQKSSGALPGPTTMVGSTVVPLRHHHHAAAACDLLPPKRCHSWNGLADLASPSTVGNTASAISPKLRKTMGSLRPRSLNLSMSNLVVPAAVVELNAKVDSGLNEQRAGRGRYRGGSADNILDIVEESEGGLSASTSGNSLSVSDLTSNATMCDSTSSQGNMSLNVPILGATSHPTVLHERTDTKSNVSDSYKPQRSLGLGAKKSMSLDILKFSEGTPPETDKPRAASEGSKSISQPMDTSTSKPEPTLTNTNAALLNKELCASNPTLATHDGDKKSHTSKNFSAVGHLSLSQPLLKHFCSSLEQLHRSLTAAHTAPSDLSHIIIIDKRGEGQSNEMGSVNRPFSPHRRSHSLGNIISPTSCDGEPTSPASQNICMKCGRTDRLNLCHGSVASSDICIHSTPKAVHDSLEMIPVL